MFGRVLGALKEGQTKSTGRLHTELCPTTDLTRDAFEELLGAIARAGLLEHAEAVFEKDGKQIPYRTVTLTEEGMAIIDPADVELLIRDANRTAKTKPAGKARKKLSATKPTSAADTKVEQSLRAWRLAEAKKRGIPAFRILTDRVLREIASDRPTTDGELLSISGIGMATVEKYGKQLYRIVGQISG